MSTRTWKPSYTQQWHQLCQHLQKEINDQLKHAPLRAVDCVRESYHRCVDVDHMGKACWTGMDYRRDREDLMRELDPILQKVNFDGVAQRCNFDFDLGWGNGLAVNISFDDEANPIVAISCMSPAVYIRHMQRHFARLACS